MTPAYRTVIAIGLEDCVKVLRGEGNDVIIALSDGTTMTGAEMLSALMAGQLGREIFAGLFHPVHGPVNLYSARFASAKQCILATAENLVCPWPDCNVPADRCQVHHIHPHNLGGPTAQRPRPPRRRQGALSQPRWPGARKHAPQQLTRSDEPHLTPAAA